MGNSEAHDDLFRSVRELCDAAVGERSVFRLLAEQGHLLFPDEMFADLYSPRGRRSIAPRVMATVMVLQRFEAGKSQTAADYIATATARRGMIERIAKVTACVDAVMMPTVPVVAPAIAAMAETEAANRTNLFLLRNPSLANFLDRCAISLPCHRAGEPPVGLMLLGEHGADRRLLAIARSVEDAVPGNG